ncbi:MAG: tRNA dihydrouridine synthase DusB [Gemmatimonadetes bacterium]|nr:tRNA dihydrouridine synthase DusB [Gemmatimonadota bacterium]
MHFPFSIAHPIPLFLAPMAGVSESPFRRICRSFGADVVVSEFLSCEGLRRGIKNVHDGAYFTDQERPLGIQLYGADPAAMGEAAGLVTTHYTPDFIDINFGCPVKKVVRRNGGSGCLKDLDLVQGIIRAVRAATHLPVTVKIRSGWDEATRDPVTIAQRCRDAGAQAITLHPRTRSQMFSGSAQWEEIARVVESVDVPVIGNGDITSAEDAQSMWRQTGCAGLMIARGAFGNPWIFQQSRDLLDGRVLHGAPGAAERFAVALRHARLAVSIQGDDRQTAIEFRKHLGWYVKGLPGASDLRYRLHQVESMGAVERVFLDYLKPLAATG